MKGLVAEGRLRYLQPSQRSRLLKSLATSNVWIVLNKIRRNTDEVLEENRAMRRQYEELKKSRKNFCITPYINYAFDPCYCPLKQ